jgi:hypothetical protein
MKHLIPFRVFIVLLTVLFALSGCRTDAGDPPAGQPGGQPPSTPDKRNDREQGY